MNDGKAVKQLVIRPASVNGAATCYVIDTAGFSYLELDLLIGSGATANAFTVTKLLESDVKASATSLTSGTEVPGVKFGTSYTLALPSNVPCAPGGTAAAATGVFPETTQYPLSALPATDFTIASMCVDVKGRKRYLLLAVTTGGATPIAAMARLSLDDVASHVPAQMVPAAAGSAAAGQVLWHPPVYPTAAGL
jgi:hypothetical protein